MSVYADELIPQTSEEILNEEPPVTYGYNILDNFYNGQYEDAVAEMVKHTITAMELYHHLEDTTFNGDTFFNTEKWINITHMYIVADMKRIGAI